MNQAAPMVSNASTANRFQPDVPLPPIDGLGFRHIRRPGDYHGMNEAANASRLADGGEFVTSDAMIEAYYEHLATTDVERDVVVAEVRGSIVGYGRVGHAIEDGVPTYELIWMVRPEWRGRGIEDAFRRALEARAREVGQEIGRPGEGRFAVESDDEAADRIELLKAAGYRPVRYSYQMFRETLDDIPDAPLPEGLEVREVRPEHLRSIWEAEVEAFRDNVGWREPVEGAFEQWIGDEIANDYSLWRVAWDGDQIAGMVRSFINEEENRHFDRRRGYVENISVRRPWRRRGLARALIAASLPVLRARGMTEGALGVDAENPNGALRLYESVGFRKAGSSTYWQRPLAG